MLDKIKKKFSKKKNITIEKAIEKTVEGLTKRDDNSSNAETIKKVNEKLEITKKIICDLCGSLMVETSSYRPESSIECINSFLNSESKMERILYSEISNYIFYLDGEEKRGIFATNVDNLLKYVNNEENKIKMDVLKITIKIFDHFHLALHQIENVNNIIAAAISSSKEEVKKELRKEFKGMEKEYISILGIFAAIILAFVGGITFSTSVLQNIHHASIYRTIFITDMIGFTLINILYLLMNFIEKINEKDFKKGHIKFINVVFIGILFLTVIAWYFNIHLYQRSI